MMKTTTTTSRVAMEATDTELSLSSSSSSIMISTCKRQPQKRPISFIGGNKTVQLQVTPCLESALRITGDAAAAENDKDEDGDDERLVDYKPFRIHESKRARIMTSMSMLYREEKEGKQQEDNDIDDNDNESGAGDLYRRPQSFSSFDGSSVEDIGSHNEDNNNTGTGSPKNNATRSDSGHWILRRSGGGGSGFGGGDGAVSVSSTRTEVSDSELLPNDNGNNNNRYTTASVSTVPTSNRMTRNSSSINNNNTTPQVIVIPQQDFTTTLSPCTDGTDVPMDLSTQLDLLTDRMEDWSITNMRAMRRRNNIYSNLNSSSIAAHAAAAADYQEQQQQQRQQMQQQQQTQQKYSLDPHRVRTVRAAKQNIMRVLLRSNTGTDGGAVPMDSSPTCSTTATTTMLSYCENPSSSPLLTMTTL